MKKYLILCISIISLFVSGCTNRDEKNVLNELTKKIDKLNSYYIDGELEIISLFVSGCTNRDEKNVLNELTKKIDKLNSYYIDGELEIINGEDNYSYDVKVSFLKDNNFKVNLKNKVNDHEQIILKNTGIKLN